MTKQSDALRLADAIGLGGRHLLSDQYEAAAELRRLHEEVTLLREQNTELHKKLAEMEQQLR